MAILWGAVGLSAGLLWWWLAQAPTPKPTAAPATVAGPAGPALPAETPGEARLEAPASSPIDEAPAVARAEGRPTRLKPSTMALPQGPLLQRRPAAPLEVSRGGQAQPVGRLLRIDTHRSTLGEAATLCLDAPATDLGGVQATCKILDGWPADQALCSRDDAAKATPLTGPITWRVPCP